MIGIVSFLALTLKIITLVKTVSFICKKTVSFGLICTSRWTMRFFFPMHQFYTPPLLWIAWPCSLPISLSIWWAERLSDLRLLGESKDFSFNKISCSWYPKMSSCKERGSISSNSFDGRSQKSSSNYSRQKEPLPHSQKEFFGLVIDIQKLFQLHVWVDQESQTMP